MKASVGVNLKHSIIEKTLQSYVISEKMELLPKMNCTISNCTTRQQTKRLQL